jgi:hypothetical protein
MVQKEQGILSEDRADLQDIKDNLQAQITLESKPLWSSTSNMHQQSNITASRNNR